MDMFSAEKTSSLTTSSLNGLALHIAKDLISFQSPKCSPGMFLLWDCFYAKLYSDRIQTF